MKYAYTPELFEIKNAERYLQPWINKGAVKFNCVKDIPKDYTLISVHFPPWRSPFKEWVEAGRNYIEIEYGYWGINNPRRNTRRVTFNGSHNLNIKDVPYSRIKTLYPAVEDWKTERGDYLLLIEPQSKIILERTGLSLGEWQEQLLKTLEPIWDGPIKWRRKSGGKNPNRWSSYIEDLSNCHAVIGERTMACVEAVMLGYPAYTTDYSAVSLIMGDDLSKIQKPEYPDRTQWLEHIAWSQFLPDEFAKGTEVADMVELYQIN